MLKRVFVAFLVGLLVPPAVFSFIPTASAQSEVERLQSQIEDRSDRLEQIEAEIAAFEAELQEVGAEKATLNNAIAQLRTEQQKVTAEIARTENLISSTDLEINKLSLEISRTERDIETTREAIGAIIRAEYKSSDETLVELLLNHEQLSEFWNSLAAHESFRTSMADKVSELTLYESLLAEKRGDSLEKREELSELRSEFAGRNEVLVNNQAEQSQLLAATQSEEAEYQRLLQQRRDAREQILSEIRSFEAELQFILDPTTIPVGGTTVFNWPLRNIIITQFFGGTEFARANMSAYGGRAYHPGVDFGAPRGTAIYAPLSGTVRATGNTDLVPGCYSWGKWSLIDHANGLSTLYAHQDVISVSPGQRVSTGEIIGYVGNTGFSTGPHLHFTVYATEGVDVRKFNEIKTVTSCGPASTPIAATEAYIDPMLYLPPY
jgi:murein DD-endopeptidase MepM/ murein hydrolase activator NlpD